MSAVNRDLSTLGGSLERVARPPDGTVADRAREVISAYARDLEDEQLLLAVLGLEEPAERTAP
ncbi:hypothetical protein ACFWA9_11285 [Kitasatospora sp. NPDC059973]|uniref:hypothetical protein n=1 Tax=unclassified Kitasatospora TaxID=2633591 RepID=UPI00331BC403